MAPKSMPASTRRDLEAFAPNVVHVSAPDFLGHAAIRWARRRGLPILASLHTRFETYPRYYGLAFAEPAIVGILRRFYGRVDRAAHQVPQLRGDLPFVQQSRRITVENRTGRDLQQLPHVRIVDERKGSGCIQRRHRLAARSGTLDDHCARRP